MRVVQLVHPKKGRHVAIVDEPTLVLLEDTTSVYSLAIKAVKEGGSITQLATSRRSSTNLRYDEVYEGASEWQLLPAFDHPTDPQHCMLSGTGLTHKASAENRQKMHQAQEDNTSTDSMKMYQWGVAGGRPNEGRVGVQPEWFYKGNGVVLKGHGDTLSVPPYADDGGEEPEVAGVYVNDHQGCPWRIGYTTANEFSDHVMERKNYLYLAPSKIRTCAIGPELIIGGEFKDISGRVSIHRSGSVLWEKLVCTGEQHMAHSLSNLEYHHFKYENHRVPGQAHVHFFGADAFSFGEGISLTNGDRMEVQWSGMGRPLRNTIAVASEEERIITVKEIK